MELPASLINSLINVQGFDKKSFVDVHTSENQVVSIRVNRSKWPSFLPYNDWQKISWSSQGFYLRERPSFTLDPLWHAGAYYVQDASSMFLEEAVRQTVDLQQPLKVLDLCAAPGGKSTLLQSILSPESLLVSNEVIQPRCNILIENITKWGAANVVITQNDPAHFKKLQGYFDMIVVDAPCSGSGLFRKDPAAIQEWSEQNVQLCNQRQQRILSDILPSLKKDGVLIYSTCSYSEEENENIADWLMKEHHLSSLRLQLDPDWNIVETFTAHQAYGYRFYPNKLKGEGFFISIFKKSNEITPFAFPKIKHKHAYISAAELANIKPYIAAPSSLLFIKNSNDIKALPKNLENELFILQSALYIRKAGTNIGSIAKETLIPAHDLALSNIKNSSIPCVIIEKDIALDYLRKNEIEIKTDIKGWALVKYEHIALGWIKILSNRINNYYPVAWRILKK